MGKNSTIHRRVRLPTPAQLIRSDLECKTRTNLPINHCAEMLTLTLRSGAGLFAQPRFLSVYRHFPKMSTVNFYPPICTKPNKI
ncbi:hypothetical protein EI220_11195 [Streptococcus suis]|uniref:Uncharacterized protein n=1 Tax=Streptococcus suis TaxID=1307 RepID=A0A426G0Y6_STRSU|nr:hypothetical protein EI220_11195 [Streptococcus suis]